MQYNQTHIVGSGYTASNNLLNTDPKLFSSDVYSEYWTTKWPYSDANVFVDYSLLSTSPCIDAGKDGLDMGSIPYSGILFY